MLNINFVPDDYIKNSESRRTNLMYLVLFLVVMTALGGSFLTIKVRQRELNTKEAFVNGKMIQAKEAIKQLEERETKLKIMIKTADTTAELLEPVPRSVLLASLTNNAPPGVSLLRLKLVQKELKLPAAAPSLSNYQAAQAKKEGDAQPKLSPEKMLETNIDIEGIAPSDLQVAAYIEHLSSSNLLNKVALVESKERKIDETVFRQFRLTAMLKKDVHLSNDDIEKIRTRHETAAVKF